MRKFDNVESALQIFESGPATPGWRTAADYLLDLLSGQSLDNIREQREIAIDGVGRAIYELGFRTSGASEDAEKVTNLHDMAIKLGLSEDEIIAKAQ